MKYNSIDKCEAINGKGFGVSLYTQGCPYHCPGCFNPETWDFDKGNAWTQETEDYIIELLKQSISDDEKVTYIINVTEFYEILYEIINDLYGIKDFCDKLCQYLMSAVNNNELIGAKSKYNN